MIKKILVLIFICSAKLAAQNQNSVWIFGDSAGIDFSSGIPVTFASGMDGRGSCCSIADSSGILLFYANTRASIVGNSGLVWNKNHLIMQNGDSIVGEGWYYEMIIIPKPNLDSLYYVFSIGVTGSSQQGFYYSIININQNGGLGAVTQKNVQLENFKVVDGMRAIKHGNGRDWWIAIRNASTWSDEQNLYLVTPSGISSSFIQSVGSANHTNAGRYAFSSDGSKLSFINYLGLLEIYDFDRCTGIISNPVTIHSEPTNPPIYYFWSAEFSPNGRFLYVTAYSDTCYLYQYDLLSPSPASTRIILDTIANDLIGIGNVRLAPNGKIYLSHAWECTAFPYCYPYPDSVYNAVNMNLSVINYPDSLGIACGYSPFSFYLGGKRTYYGLPNNPDYSLGPLIGSPCDTLGVGISEAEIKNNVELFVFYHAGWQKLFVNAQNLKGKNCLLQIFDITGKLIHSNAGGRSPSGAGGNAGGYFTEDVNCTAFAKGMYVVSLRTEKEFLRKKFIKQ